MLFNNKEFIQLCINNRNYNDTLNKINEAKELEITRDRNSHIDNIYSQRENRIKLERAYNTFIKDTKTSLLSECMYTLMNKACGYQQNEVQADIIKRNLVNNYIEEQGVDRILSSFKGKTFMLSEFARIIESTTKSILEKVDKNDTDTFNIEQEEKDKFFDELNFDDVEEVSSAIKKRVSDAVDEFMYSNIKQKEELKEILTASKEKIDSSKNEEVKESYNILAKKAITNLKAKRKVNIFESMVVSLAEASLKNENLKELYAKDNKLDMDSIVENVTIMYTFLETLNSAQIHNVNESYISDVLKELKK